MSRSFTGWSDSFLRTERLSASGAEAQAMDLEIARRRVAQQKLGEMSRRIREIRDAAVAAGDWNRVQICDIAAYGIVLQSEHFQVGALSYSMEEARRELGLGDG